MISITLTTSMWATGEGYWSDLLVTFLSLYICRMSVYSSWLYSWKEEVLRLRRKLVRGCVRLAALCHMSDNLLVLRFFFLTHHSPFLLQKIIGVFKPKSEEPYGHLNPKWTKYFHKVHCVRQITALSACPGYPLSLSLASCISFCSSSLKID